jgi:hypothetical protein
MILPHKALLLAQATKQIETSFNSNRAGFFKATIKICLFVSLSSAIGGRTEKKLNFTSKMPAWLDK